MPETPSSRDQLGPAPLDVCLVQMPYSGLDRPSIALALLKQYLTTAGMRSKVVYGNIEFADVLGVDIYRTFEETPSDSLIGEWTFAGAAFGKGIEAEEAFLKLVVQRISHSHWFEIVTKIYPHLDVRKLLWTVRQRAEEFVEEMARKVLAMHPRIVGCTSMFQQHCGSLALLRRIKELAPQVVTMLGGANCEGLMGQTTHEQCPWVDFVASGEADAYFGDLCRRILDGGPAIPREELPDGVFGPAHRSRVPARRSPGSLTVLQAHQPAAPKVGRAVLESMDQAAVPDYEEYFETLRTSFFGDHVKPFLLFESSRGCWWGMKHHCTFCGLNGDGMAFRSKSAGRVLEEVSALRQLYGTQWMSATDNIIDMRHVKTVLPTLAALEEPPYLFYEVKANLKKDQIRMLSDAGVRRIQPGIESLHDEVLKLLRKGNSWFINVQLLKWSQEMGIHVFWNFLSGAPGESEDWYWEVAEWLPWIYHLEPPGEKMSEIRYDRFSPYHESPDTYGLKLVPGRAYRHVYPWPAEALENFAYFFEDQNRPPFAARGPAYVAMAQRIEEWNRANTGSGGRPPARLVARDEGDRAKIEDTRTVATAPTLTLTGVEYLVWKACDAAHSRDELLSVLRTSVTPAPSLSEVWAAVEKLKSLRIVLEWHGRILSLTVNEPITPYPPVEPGFFDIGKLLKKVGPRSIGRACMRPPSQVRLSELWAGMS